MSEPPPTNDERLPMAPQPKLKIGFLDLPEIPDSVFFEPMTEAELAEWE